MSEVDLPDWLLNGVELRQQAESMKRKARAAWRSRSSVDAVQASEALHVVETNAAAFEQRLFAVRSQVSSYRKQSSEFVSSDKNLS